VKGQTRPSATAAPATPIPRVTNTLVTNNSGTNMLKSNGAHGAVRPAAATAAVNATNNSSVRRVAGANGAVPIHHSSSTVRSPTKAPQRSGQTSTQLINSRQAAPPQQPAAQGSWGWGIF
jgi:hypothetical protein